MAWLYLLIAGLFEVGWAVGIKYCEGFKLNGPLIIVIISMIFSMVFLWLALKTLPISIAYTVWTGIGIVGVCVYDLLILKNSLSLLSVFFIAMILFGIIGLKLTYAK